MNSADLHKLLRFVADKRLKESYEIVQGMTMQERETLAAAFDRGSEFLRKVNADWGEIMNYPAKNEE